MYMPPLAIASRTSSSTLVPWARNYAGCLFVLEREALAAHQIVNDSGRSSGLSFLPRL
jgi:hypothetical protein